MLLLWTCLLLPITLYIVVVNKSYSKAVVVVVAVVNVVVVAMFVVIGHIMFIFGQSDAYEGCC